MNCSVLDVNENELNSSCGYTEATAYVEPTSSCGHTEPARNLEPNSSCDYTEPATYLEPNISSSYTELESVISNEPSSSYTITELGPTRNAEPSVTDGLPSLEEFCANTSDHCVRSIYNMIGERGDSEHIFQLLSNLPLQLEPSVDNGDKQLDNRLAADDGQPGTSSSTLVRQQSTRSEQAEWNAIISPPETSFSTANARGGISVIGHDQLMATPNNNEEGHATNETTSNQTDSLPTQLGNNSHSIEPDESQIEEAFRSVYERFGATSDKDLNTKLTAETLERCLDSIHNAPLLICNSCLELFQHIPHFQVHIQTCCAAPRIELKQKMDHAAMNQLARALWKEVFIKDLKSHTPERVYDEPSLHTELDVLWEMDSSSTTMIKCREFFIRASVAIVSRKWVSIAVVNEFLRMRKSQQNKQAKKRTKAESDLEEEVVGDLKPMSSSSKTGKSESKKKKRGRQPKTKEDKFSKITETDLAIRGLVHDLDESGRTPLGYHFTPETPVSDHGLDFTGFTPTSRTSTNRDETIKTPYSDSGVEFTPEMDCEIDRFVRDEQLSAIDVDKLASEAAKDFENIVNGADPWDNGTSEDALSENEFVVGKILERRLRFKVENQIPQENDYEYLVSWEGYSDEDNTWEPYENLMHCTLKLKEFHDRLKLKAMKCRKGKRI